MWNYLHTSLLLIDLTYFSGFDFPNTTLGIFVAQGVEFLDLVPPSQSSCAINSTFYILWVAKLPLILMVTAMAGVCSTTDIQSVLVSFLLL